MKDSADGLSWTGLSVEDLGLYSRALADGSGALDAAHPEQVARLVDSGFLSRGRVVAPASALRTALHSRFAQAHERLAELEAASDTIDAAAARLATSTHAGIAVHGIELITGIEQVGGRANELVDAARSELLVLNAPPYAQRATEPYQDELAAQRAAETNQGLAVARGVQVRHVFTREALDLPGRMASVTELADLGMGVRVHAAVPTKMILVDRTTALLPPSPAADPLEQALVIHDGLLVNALLPLFESLWDTGVPLSAVASAAPAADADAGAPSDDERVLIAMLASGLKDEAIARQLDVHVHTARRRITALVERLDATTRFQAGLQAARRGWLD